MFLSLDKYKNETILCIKCSIIDDNVAKNILKRCSNGKVGLDMKNVKSISSKIFISCLIENKFKLYNVQNEVLIYLAIIMKEGFLKSYMSLDDLSNDKRELIKRHFLVA